MEVFEKVGENKDLMFKALSRRALSRKEIKEYKEALEDINQALKLSPNDNQALLLKKEIESFVQHSETVAKLIRENKEAESKEVAEAKPE
jgi:tetratricopeptide (TPR) repeat protein